MIECELPDEQVLLSDFDAWHLILNDDYIGLSEDDYDAFHAEVAAAGHTNDDALPQHLQKRLRRSWERAIDFEELASPYWGEAADKSIQACFWKIDIEQVKSHRRFTSSYPKNRQS